MDCVEWLALVLWLLSQLSKSHMLVLGLGQSIVVYRMIVGYIDYLMAFVLELQRQLVLVQSIAVFRMTI